MTTRIDGRERGVLLLESLLAATVLSVCLAVFVQTLMLGLRVMQDMEDYTTAIFLLENKMVSLVTRGYIADSFKEEDALGKPDEKYQYILESFPIRHGSREKDINEVKLTVRWLSNKNPRDISLTTYLFKKKE